MPIHSHHPYSIGTSPAKVLTRGAHRPTCSDQGARRKHANTRNTRLPSASGTTVLPFQVWRKEEQKQIADLRADVDSHHSV